jgi:hypothetical protein
MSLLTLHTTLWSISLPAFFSAKALRFLYQRRRPFVTLTVPVFHFDNLHDFIWIHFFNVFTMQSALWNKTANLANPTETSAGFTHYKIREIRSEIQFGITCFIRHVLWKLQSSLTMKLIASCVIFRLISIGFSDNIHRHLLFFVRHKENYEPYLFSELEWLIREHISTHVVMGRFTSVISSL